MDSWPKLRHRVAVGMTLTAPPRTYPGVRNYRTGLLPRVRRADLLTAVSSRAHFAGRPVSASGQLPSLCPLDTGTIPPL